MYQKCPICNGKGWVCGVSSCTQTCPTCNGKRIISDVDGKPPKSEHGVTEERTIDQQPVSQINS